ncbi:cytochrome P450 [Mycena epipterygia]|nr:cytochrome P450 [Mycena epipterygia]KAJ7126090.1 cytochrome P450 [Mycena epipterygia]
MEPLTQAIVALSIVWVLYNIYRRWTRISVADIAGPEPESFLLGCLPEFLQCQAGESDFKWQARYGNVVRIRGILGSDRLLVSDPKALQHIYNSGYNIRKQGLRSEIARILTGPGLAWANTAALSQFPGIWYERSPFLHPHFLGIRHQGAVLNICVSRRQHYRDQLSSKWKELTVDGSAVVNTPRYFSRFFLDVIGEVAFDYQFGATKDEQDPLAKALSSVIPMFSVPSKTAIFIVAFLEFLPITFVQLFMRYAPFSGLRNSRRVTQIAIGIAKELVDEKAEALVAGKGKRDIMSLLVKANASANPRTNLSEGEVLAQMQTIMQAGHETTANTMSWTLFELSKQPEVQAKLRAEIMATERAMHARGDTEFTYTDFEAMSYTTAVMKETFRFHPVSYSSVREAARDEVLPLSKPLVTKSGKTITEIPIPKNIILVVSIAGYNRNPDVFGEDAHVFRPERWLDGTVQTSASLGVYGNLMTFGSGHRACIGWRFAVYEYQTFLVELVKNFEFSMDPSLARKVRREASIAMFPTISGEVLKGPQLPITIRAVDTL